MRVSRQQLGSSIGGVPRGEEVGAMTPGVFWVGMVYVLLPVVLLLPVTLRASAPKETVRATVEEVLAILNDPNLKSADKTAERRAKLKAAIYPKFDFIEMGKRSLGPNWQRMSEDQRKAFVEVFGELLETSYSDKLDSYQGEKVVLGRERPDGGFAEVDSEIIAGKGPKYSITYRLHQTGGDWKIYDVVIENVSLVNNYRSQFQRVLSESSIQELIDRLKKKQFQVPTGKGGK